MGLIIFMLAIITLWEINTNKKKLESNQVINKIEKAYEFREPEIKEKEAVTKIDICLYTEMITDLNKCIAELEQAITSADKVLEKLRESNRYGDKWGRDDKADHDSFLEVNL